MRRRRRCSFGVVAVFAQFIVRAASADEKMKLLYCVRPRRCETRLRKFCMKSYRAQLLMWISLTGEWFRCLIIGVFVSLAPRRQFTRREQFCYILRSGIIASDIIAGYMQPACHGYTGVALQGWQAFDRVLILPGICILRRSSIIRSSV